MGLKTVPATLKAKVLALKRWITSSKKRKSLATLTGILLIALAGQIVYSSFAATTAYSSNPEVAKMQKLTEEVVSMTDEYASMPDTISTKKGAAQPNTAKTTKQQELIAKVKERKAAYLIASQYDPQTTANSYLPYTTRDKLPTDAKLYTETAVDVQGVWAAGTTESEQGTRTLIKLQLDDGTRLAVYGVSLPNYASGAKVSITGIQLDHTLIAALPYIQKNSQVVSKTQSSAISMFGLLAPKVEAASSLCEDLLGPLTGKLCPDEEVPTGDGNGPRVVFCEQNDCFKYDSDPVTNEKGGRKVLVVALALPGEDGGIFSDGETYNIDEITEAYTNVQNMYSIMSYGKFRPDVTVHPRYVQMLPEDFFDYDSIDWECGDTLYDEVERAAVEAINRNSGLQQQAEAATDIALLYNNVPCDRSSGGGRQGWAYVGVSRGDTKLKGHTNNILSGASLTKLTSTFAHEFGHSIGLEHTGAACAQDSNRCDSTQASYGDIYNMMGGDLHEEYTSDSFSGDSKSFNSLQRQRLGWIDEAGIAEMPSDTTSFQTSLNALWQGTGTRGVKFAVGGRTYLIEYRPKTSHGIDNFTSGKMSDGILVYQINTGSACSDGNCSVDSLLMNGKKGDKYEEDGQEYYEWDYTKAATKEPFKIVNTNTGDEVCVTPAGLAQDSLSLNVDRDCKDVKTGDYSLVAKWGSAGTGDGQFSNFIEDVETDAQGNVYALDADGVNVRRIEKFDSTGKFISKWGSYGTGDGQFKGGASITVDTSGNFYLAEGYSGIIRKFDKDGKTLKVWGGRGTQDGQFDYAMDLDTDSSGNVYVTDYSNNRIQKFDSNGKFISKWGSYGTGDGQFSTPQAIAIDHNNNVYVTDVYNNRIQKFDSTGKFISKWGSRGSANGQFQFPEAVATDKSGNVYTYEDGVDRIQKFDPNGGFITSWSGYKDPSGNSGSGEGTLALDDKGNVFIVDYFPFIQKFSRTTVDTKDFRVLGN